VLCVTNETDNNEEDWLGSSLSSNKLAKGKEILKRSDNNDSNDNDETKTMMTLLPETMTTMPMTSTMET